MTAQQLALADIMAQLDDLDAWFAAFDPDHATADERQQYDDRQRERQHLLSRLERLGL